MHVVLPLGPRTCNRDVILRLTENFAICHLLIRERPHFFVQEEAVPYLLILFDH
jgi:hypothetical protein